MALAVSQVLGKNSVGTQDTITTDAFTSVANSLLIAVVAEYNGTDTSAGTDVTDSKGNSYTLALANIGGVAAIGAAIYYNNNGTRGASHTITYNVPGTGQAANIAVCEVTGQDLTAAVFDTTTDATSTDAVTPYNVTAAAAIVGNQIAIYGVTLSTGGDNPFTQPGGYSNIFNNQNGAELVSDAAYKLNETGTPTVGADSAHSPSAARVLFATFKEAEVPVPIAWITA